MPDGGEPVKVKILNDIAEIEPAEWDACAGPDNPFVSHGFLRILEQSGSVCGRTGWLPQHLAIEDDDGRLIGAVPCYLKSHPMASTCSTGAGRTRSSAPAESTTRSCRSRCLSPRSPGLASWSAPARRRTRPG